MSADIEISADTTQAVSAVGALGKALEELGKANLSDKAFKSYTNAIERDLGKMAAKMANINREVADEQSKFAQFAQGKVGPSGNRFGLNNGITQGMAAARRETDAANLSLTKTLSLQERMLAASRASGGGLTQNSAGRWINAKGQFVSDKELANAGSMTSQYERLISLRKQDREIGAQTQAGMMLENNLASKFVDRQSEIARIRQRSAQQAMLETAFSKKIYGMADPGATKLQRVANVMRQIPPASWGQKIGKAASALSGMSNSTRYALYDVSNSAGIAGAAIMGLGVAAVGAAIAHERAFANVRRTTMTTTAGYEQLRVQLEAMAATMPTTYAEITQIATAAGQLGIGASGVAQFTSTVAKLSATTNLTSDAAATALARFRAFFAEVGRDKGLNVTESTFSNLASSILKVGVNSIATETGIAAVATQIASMGQYSGMTANQVIGLAGALSSIGVAPELSRGTITRTFSLIGTAVSKGGDKLERFAALAGMSAEQFKASWGTDTFAATFQAMMTGLYNVTQSGEDANLMLMDLGFNSVRDRPLLLRLAGAADEAGKAGGLLAQTMQDALSGWTQNSELALQYNKISTTTSARIQVLGQAFERLFASMGKQTGGFLGEAAANLTTFINGLHDLSTTPAGQIMGTIGTQGAIAAGGLLLAVAAAARVVANLQGIGTAYREMSAAGVTSLGRLGGALRAVGLAMGALGIIGLVVSLGGALIGMASASEKAKRAVQDVSGLISAMKSDTENGAEGVKIFTSSTTEAADEQARAAKQASSMGVALGEVGRAASKAKDGIKSYSDAVLTFGPTAESFVKSQLSASDTFQSLFDPGKHWGGFFGWDFGGVRLQDLGFDPRDLDWDKFMKDSLSGTLDKDDIYKQITDMMGGGTVPIRSDELMAAKAYASDIFAVYGDLKTEIQSASAASSVLETSTAAGLKNIAEGGDAAVASMMGLDESIQKILEASAGGLSKFADPGKLIGLTQASISDADAFKKAWTDAYGGAEFSLGSYLDVFRKAAGEQDKFYQNLEELSSRGLSRGIIEDLTAMGPEAAQLVQALVNGTADQLSEFESLWGQTGFEAMLQMAAQMRIAQDYVEQAMRISGIEGVKKFNEAIAAGINPDTAIAKLQREFDNKPVVPKVNEPKVPGMSWAQKKLWEAQNQLTATARVRILPIAGGAGITVRASDGSKKVTLYPGFATGGHVTGPGSGTSDSIPTYLSNGEFVMTAKATRAIGVSNLYSMMHAAQGSRRAPRGRGYASGGLVGGSGGNSGPNIVYLSPEDRALIRSIQPVVRIGNRDIAQAQADANFVSKRQGVG